MIESVAPGARKGPLARERARWAVAFLVPALLLILAIAGWPLARTAMLAFTDARLDQVGAAGWVGLENFRTLMGDEAWWIAVGNTVVFALVSVSFELALGLSFALLLHTRLMARGALRAIALIPWAVPTIVAAQMWAWMFHDFFGVVNDMGLRLGLIDAPIAWLAERGTALAAVIVADVWKTTPFVTLLLLANLQTIPADLYAAARIDGATAWRTLLYVTLPLLKPAIVLVLIFRTIDALRVFDLIYVMTSNSQDTATISIYARQHLIGFQELGYGSAASILVFLMVALLSVGYILALAPRESAQ